MWRETTKHERNMRIWQEELDEFVPKKVLDFHVHVFCEDMLAAKYFEVKGDFVKITSPSLMYRIYQLWPEIEQLHFENHYRFDKWNK